MSAQLASHVGAGAPLLGLLALVVGMPAVSAAGAGGSVVQTGGLAGSAGPPETHEIVLAQFDDLAGSRVLTSVVIDQASNIKGGGTEDGSGIPTVVHAHLSTDVSLAGAMLTSTEPAIDFTFANTRGASFTLFGLDSDQVTITTQDLAPWTGAGSITLDAVTEFVLDEQPAGTVGFGAGGGVNYTVTYHFVDAPVSYCTAGTAASGCQASLSATGVPSASAASGFSLHATNVEGAKDGLLFFGSNGRQANAWGNGTSFQCVAPPVMRGGLLASTGTPGACDGAFAQDLNARWTAKPAQNPGAGAIVQAQLWYRDPLGTSNQTTSLSDALEFCIQP